MARRKNVTVYTDGACLGNPGPGGWAAILLYNDHRKEISGGEEHTTNQRMELLAAIKALEALKYPCRVELFSDSAYLVNAFERGWLARWQENGWKTSSKSEVENRDLWERLLELARVHEVRFFKVKGHSDSELNNRCDALARAEALERKREPV